MLINVRDNENNLPIDDGAQPSAAARAQAAAELHLKLEEFNRNSVTYPRGICLHQLFEQQVARTPNAISLVFGDTAITYKEMNARANQVAHRLRKLGAKSETLVGVCMERSLEMVIAMYGILKAGGAYVPLDPSYPAERLAFMMEDAIVPILLTQQHLLENLPPHNAQVVCLDTEWESIAQEEVENPANEATEENLAYVIFTSGSTGRPKGVMIEHRGICNQLQWMQDRYPMSTADAVLLKTPFSFDLSLYEFFSPLIAGARLIIAKPEGQKDTGYLIELMQRERVTHLFMVPSHVQMLLEKSDFTDCSALKHIFCSGEALPFAVQQRFFAQMPSHIALTNLYGPTEASVECTFWDCERDTKRNIVPVGRPIANYKIHILDEQFHPVPIGTAGELFIESIGLARGYLNRPALTEEKFLKIADLGLRIADSQNSNPQSQIRNPQLYRTGDLARWLPEGIVECLGRIDFQVKIRGHRIELGEIETDLTQHPAVREAVVIAREDVPGDKRLVAYFVTQTEQRPTNHELRNFLQHKLPEYMVPALFIRLDALPLSPNGKIDRKQLPAPHEVPLERATDFVAPANEIETKLQTIWEEALHIHPISVTDNFFDLGGHSLLAVRIFWALEKEFGKQFPLATLFQYPTIGQLAALLQEQHWQPSWSSLVPLQIEGNAPPFFCVHAIGGNVLEYYELARQMGTEQPFFGLQSRGLDGNQEPLTSIEAMATHYIHEIRQVQPEGPYYLGGRSFGGVVAYEMAQQLHQQGKQIALLALLDTDPLGWLKRLPRSTALRLRCRFFARRIKQHLSNVNGLAWHSRLGYLHEKAVYKKRKLETWQWKLQRSRKLTQDLNKTLRDVEEFNYLAAEKYRPKPYPGRVTFFCARAEVSALENEYGWKTLASGGVEVIDVPGDHQSMIKPPHVELLATQLQSRLSKTMTPAHQPLRGNNEMRPLTQRIENLSPAKRALLEMQLRGKTRRNETGIQPRENPITAPLTFNQESLWFLEQLNPNTATYNLYDALRLRGKLDLGLLQRTLETIVQRHESLRTTIQTIDGEAQQIIHPSLPIQIKHIDLSPTHAEKREHEVLQILTREAEQPFDLAAAPLVRFALVKLQDNEFIFFVLMHHILSDGWSIGIFWQEFTQIYNSLAQGIPSTLAPLPIQFGDFAAWQQRQKAAAIEQQLSYWKQQLADAPSLLQLPTDAPRPAVQSFRGAQVNRLFTDELRNELKEFSRREGATLFMTLLTAFKALLVRYTEQEDIVLGAPLAGRTEQQTENLIGFFANVLVLRTDLSGDPDFRSALRQCRETVLGAFSHQDVPFEKLVQELRPERSLSHNPIFQIAFALQPENSGELAIEGFELNPIKISVVNSKFDMFFSLAETPAGLRATVEYNTDLFAPSTIEQLLTRYQNLLTAILANPAARISTLPMLTATEQQLLSEWNTTATAYPHDICVHTLFEKQAQQTPDAVAVIADEVHLTYRELNRRANQVAHYLRKQGVQPDTLVGLFTERSLLMVIGVLGILKAGGAYLPLDPGYPKSRLAFMLDDAQTPVILTQHKLRAGLPENAAHIICLDADAATIAAHSEVDPDNITHAENLAYAIYTSGSTGQPKGTVIEHRAVSRLVHNTNYLQLNAQDCIAQISNISFDAATFELWGALLHGAKLALINKEIALSPKEFVAQLRAKKITTMFVTTALFNLLSREVPTAFSTLKTVMFGGEACDPDCVREVLKNGAPQRLLHVYGPTESTTFATWHLVTEVSENATTIPIGRPISNTTIHILDRNFQPVPVGIPGEIFIGGDGLARGYLNRPALTEEKFLAIADCGLQIADSISANPQSAIPHQQLYRTGDIARFLPDGSIEFIGRKDSQIKLRGFRIELGEIESAVLAHPAIKDCVIVVAANSDADKRLLAYFVAAQHLMPTPQELRAFLQQQLPDFMIPAQFIALPEMPLNQNGKVDRKKLPQPENLLAATVTEFVAPSDELETQLTQIWAEKLSVQRVSINDNFFALGGHSLIAVRVFSALEKSLGIRLPLATLFKAPTIKQLATAIRELGWESSWHSIVPLQAQGTRPPFFCVHAVGGNVLEYQDLAHYINNDQPFYALQSLGLDGKQTPLTNIEEMAAHYIQEIRLLQPNGPYYLGGRSFGGTVAFEMAQQLHAQGETIAVLAMLDTYPLGWQQLLSQEEAERMKKEFLRLRIKRHLSNLRQLSLSGKIDYVLTKADYKKRKYKNWLWRAQQKFGGAEATSLQHALRNIEELNYLAAKKYTPQRYPGQVTFFCANEEISLDENLTGWQILAAGGLEVVTVPGDHQTMIKEPHVQQLAAQLDECLQRAQTQ